MPKITYINKRFNAGTIEVLGHAVSIIDEYQAAGYNLTLRQLYYQFVSRDLLPNRQKEYKRLGNIINDGRLAGVIDWDAIEDRTRGLRGLSHWSSPEEIISGAARSYRVDKWQGQPVRMELWVEKEALAGVFARVCNRNDVPYLSCKGYTSQSEMWRGAMRLKEWNKPTVILHFGDHDPSGIDMTRDIEERMDMFGCSVEVRRLALNMDQVEEHSPPPNPAKVTDSRFESYQAEFGDESWELDALEPSLLESIVQREIDSVRNMRKWERRIDEEREGRALLNACADRWGDVVHLLS